jgi:hypothetical protein
VDVCNTTLGLLCARIPRDMVGEEEASQVSLPLSFANISKLYPLISRAPKQIRNTAYLLLLDHIKLNKEAVEIEAALAPAGDVSHIHDLPEELLSIIVDADVLSDVDPDVDNSRSQLLEGYLMSWSLIFQHFVDSVRLILG